jgi:hypothetical protein
MSPCGSKLTIHDEEEICLSDAVMVIVMLPCRWFGNDDKTTMTGGIPYSLLGIFVRRISIFPNAENKEKKEWEDILLRRQCAMS